MIRILALILSLSVCLLSSARGESVFLASVHEDKTVSVNSTSTPEKHALTGTKVGKARLVLSAAHSSKPRHKNKSTNAGIKQIIRLPMILILEICLSLRIMNHQLFPLVGPYLR